MKNLKLYLLAFTALLTIGAANAQKYDLKYNLPQGAKFISRQSSVQSINQQMMGMNNDMKVTVDAITSYMINKIEDGNYHMSFTYDSLKMRIESPVINMAYDSSKPEDTANPFNQAMGSLVGEKFDIVMNPKGKVLSVVGFSAIMDKMMAKMNNNTAMAQQISESLKQQFGDEAIKGSIEMATAIFPTNEVAVGETWVNESVMMMTAQMTNKSTITLKDVKDGQWFLEGTSTLSTNKDAAMQMNGMTQHMDLKGTASFQTTLSATSGWLVNSSVNNNIEGTMFIEGGQLPAAMEIPMKIASQVTVVTL